MIAVCRRRLLVSLVAVLALGAAPVLARPVTDSAGRQVDIPDSIAHVYPAGPPASVLLYVLAPQMMSGWTHGPATAEQKRFVLPEAAALPEIGRLTGQGDALTLDAVQAAKPDLIVDFGTISDSYRALADRVQAQTGIPYLLIDGRFENTPAALRLLGDILGVKPRGEALAHAAEDILASVDQVVAQVAAAKRPRVYLARGPDGTETSPRGAINAEIIARVGGTNVVDSQGKKGGVVSVTPDQVAAWAPDTIITVDRDFHAGVAAKPAWQAVPAVSAHRVLLAPSLPFGFIDEPPSVNRLIGLTWLLHALYPDQAPGKLRDQVRDFYHLFYQVDLSDADLDHLLDGAGG